jgi:hypothetical protein
MHNVRWQLSRDSVMPLHFVTKDDGTWLACCHFDVKSSSMVTQQKYLSTIELSYYPAEFQQLRRCQMPLAQFHFHSLWYVLWYTCSKHIFLNQFQILSAQPESEPQRMQYEVPTVLGI